VSRRLKSFLRKAHRRLSLLGPGAARIELGGRRFTVPKIGGSMCQITEPWMVEVLAAILPLKPGLFLDVGVNLGQTLLALKAAAPERPYLGIEPNPLCIAYVDALIEVNRISETALIAVGLGNETGLRRLHFYNDSTTGPGATFVENFRPDQKVTGTRILPMATYSDVQHAAGIEKLGVVKIDVEGGEADVVASLRGAIAADRPWILIEILPCYDAANTARVQAQNALEAAFRDLGYTKLRIRKAPAEAFQGLEPIASIGIHGDLALSDYLCVPEADVAMLGVSRPSGL
jgi:FkbM family methyltransferase